QILVVEILGTEPRQRDLERVDRLRVVALGLPRVRDAALAQGLERPGRPLSDGELPGAAGLAVLLGVEAQVAELVRHLGGAGTRSASGPARPVAPGVRSAGTAETRASRGPGRCRPRAPRPPSEWRPPSESLRARRRRRRSRRPPESTPS